MKVLIIDDQELIRDCIGIQLRKSFLIDSLDVVGDGLQAVGKLRHTHYDLILVEYELKEGINGIALIEQIITLSSSSMVVLLSWMDDFAVQRAACKIGARGYLNKKSKNDKFIESLDQILAGNKVFNEKIFIDSESCIRSCDCEERSPWDLPLTKREKEVFMLTVMGYSVGDIAEQLGIMNKTVDNHRKNISEKLDCNKRYEWVMIAKQYQMFH